MSTTTAKQWNLDGAVPRGGLLTRGNPKTAKGEKYGYLTAILHLSPADKSGRNVCPHASDGCRAACLDQSGHGGINLDSDGLNSVQAARIRRTRYWARDRAGFLRDLVREIENHEKHAERHDLRPTVRLNGTSDLPWERWPVERGGKTFANVFAAFPGITFYDYTKWPTAKRRKACPDWPENYSLTFSLSETNAEQAARELEQGINVAAPFAVSTAKAPDGGYRDALPPLAMIEGTISQVIDGDDSDLRFTDPVGVIVGLRAKAPNGPRGRAIIAEGIRAGFILPA
jgi:hypothetical protein